MGLGRVIYQILKNKLFSVTLEVLFYIQMIILSYNLLMAEFYLLYFQKVRKLCLFKEFKWLRIISFLFFN